MDRIFKEIKLLLIRIFKSSHRKCSMKKLSLKIRNSLRKTPVLESYFDKVAGLKASNFI